MAWTSPRTWVTGELVTAAMLNTHLRDNLLATGAGVVTTQGDLLYATAANTLARLPKGAAGTQLTMNPGATAPEWTAERINEVTLSGTASDISFGSIPSTYRHLWLEYVLRNDTAETWNYARIQFNGDTGNNYDSEAGYFHTGSSVGGSEEQAAASARIARHTGTSATANVANYGRIEIPYYSATTFHKMAIEHGGVKFNQSSGGVVAGLATACWRNTAAISAIKIIPTANNFIAGSKISLFGVL